MNTWLTAFVDETGTNELDSTKRGVSHLFICVAVLVDSNERLAIEAALRKISQDLCGGVEISSKRIAGDHQRRLKFLERLIELPYTYFALVINKDRIIKDSGLRFKTSFYKYINRMLYLRLAQPGFSLRIIADQFGGEDFMNSFRPYLNSRGLPDLFNNCTHNFGDSALEPGIQLADLIAGTLAYCFDPKKKCDQSPLFWKLLSPHAAGIQIWPWTLAPELPPPPPDSAPDVHLENQLQVRVQCFLTKHEDSTDMDRQMQAATLARLLFVRHFEDRDRQAIVSDILIEHLVHHGYEKLPKQAFQSRVIGRLRDDGIVLAGTADGYRLALTEADIQDYLDHDRTIMEPMLRRMNIARETVMLHTTGRYDILAQPQYQTLKKLAETYKHSIIINGTVPHSA